MTTHADLQTPYMQNWCPGCGNISIWAAFKGAIVREGWDSTNTTFVADVGCNGHISNFTHMTSFISLHGRAIPVATGIKLANNRLNVFAFIGDGGCMGEGGNHFIHACRRNHDITIVIHNNTIYGLTTGQTSPTTPHDYVSKSTPDGNPDWPLKPATLAIASGATFVARVYSGDITKVSDTLIEANNHRGISIVEILQPCVTFHKQCTHKFYQDNIYELSEGYDPTDKVKAFEKSLEWGEKKVPVGILYRQEKESYESQIPQIKEHPAIEADVVRNNLEPLFEKWA